MRQVKVLVTYLVIVFGGAAALSPMIYNGIQELSRINLDWWKVDQFADYLSRHPFHRYVHRCMLGLALIGLPMLLKELKVPNWRDLGMQWPNKRNLGFLAAAFLVGFSTLAIGTAMAVGAGSRSFNLDHSAVDLIRHFKNAALAALVVSLMEELIFRGALFQAFRSNGSFVWAALVSSAIYAIVHFFEGPENPRRIEPFSGLMVLGQMMRGFFPLDELVPAFFNLVLAGLILALAFERTRNLYFSIGIHAAFIFWGKSFGFFTRQNPGASESTWGGDRLINGWFPFLLLAFLLVFLDRILPRAPVETRVIPPPLPYEYQNQRLA